MFINNGTSVDFSSQLEAELAEFEEVLREHKVSLNPANYIPLSPEEYEESMQVLEEFLNQEGFGSDPENNPPVEQPDNVPAKKEESLAISFNSTIPPAPGNSITDMINLYLGDEDFDMEPLELNLGPVCNFDLSGLELDDLFFHGMDESGSSNDTPVLIAEKPVDSSENTLLEPVYSDGMENTYGSPPVLTAQVTPNDLRDTEEISIDTMDIYCHEPMDMDPESISKDTKGIPTDTEDITDTEGIPTDTEGIPTDTEDIPTDTDDISTEPENSATDDEGISTDTENITTSFSDFHSSIDGLSVREPVPYTLDTWKRENDGKETLKRKKTNKDEIIHASTPVKFSGTTSRVPKRRLFQKQKVSSPSVPESVSFQTRTSTNENESPFGAKIRRKKKAIKEACAEKKLSDTTGSLRRSSRRVSSTYRRT